MLQRRRWGRQEVRSSQFNLGCVTDNKGYGAASAASMLRSGATETGAIGKDRGLPEHIGPEHGLGTSRGVEFPGWGMDGREPWASGCSLWIPPDPRTT